MAELTYRDAVARGIAQEMMRDPDVIFFGEDVAKAGGVFKTTVGLHEQFGDKRVRDCPISEQAILGAAMGAAMTGLKPIAEIMFSDFFAVCFDYIANEFSKSRYMSNGQLKCPLVVRTANGAGSRFGAQHSQSELRAKADADSEEPGQGAATAPAARSGACCGIASGLTRMFEKAEANEKGEMTLADIRKTYQGGSREPAQEAQPSAAAPLASPHPAAMEKAKSA